MREDRLDDACRPLQRDQRFARVCVVFLECASASYASLTMAILGVCKRSLANYRHIGKGRLELRHTFFSAIKCSDSGTIFSTTVALDMTGPSFAESTTVLALRHWPSFLVHVVQLAICQDD